MHPGGAGRYPVLAHDPPLPPSMKKWEPSGPPSRPRPLPAGTPGPAGCRSPPPLQLFWQGWHIRDIARDRIPWEDWVPPDQISLVAPKPRWRWKTNGFIPTTEWIRRDHPGHPGEHPERRGGGRASTLTQQLVKNLPLTSDQTLGRKLGGSRPGLPGGSPVQRNRKSWKCT